MKSPVPAHPPHIREASFNRQNGWRDLIVSGADLAAIDGFTLEHLIDHQRASAHGDDAGK